MKKKLVILSGAGLDEESGIPTFRDADGLWNNHKVEKVATYKGWLQDPKYVLDFYNEMRSKLKDIQPNKAHTKLAELEQYFDVQHITQNVSDLLERGGCTNILHLHGELTKAKDTDHNPKIFDIGYNDIKFGDTNDNGCQIRPHIVWFGEDVPELENAIKLVQEADIVIVIGTSLQVYPAAGLLYKVKYEVPKYIINPNDEIETKSIDNLTYIQEKASTGVEKLFNILTNK